MESLEEHPREGSTSAPRRRRSKGWRAARFALVTGIIGALAVVAAAQAGGVHWSLRAISWVLFGFMFGAVFGPFFALARETGEDEVIREQGVAVHGQSDTSFEGAQAHDLRRAAGPDSRPG
jgi:fatty acid desaturase